MPYFHSTLADSLPSIRRHGLGGVDPGPRSVDCERGVYLADNPLMALCIALEHYLCTMGAPSPRDAVAAIRVIVVDDSRVDRARLEPDPHAPDGTGCWLYAGVIDVTGLPVLTVDEVHRGWREQAPAA